MSPSPPAPSTMLARVLVEVRDSATTLAGAQAALTVPPASRWSSLLAMAGIYRSPMGGVSRGRHAFDVAVAEARERWHSVEVGLEELFAQHPSDDALVRLRKELEDVGLDAVGATLRADAVPAERREAMQHVAPAIARVRIVERHLVAAQQQLLVDEARRSSPER